MLRPVAVLVYSLQWVAKSHVVVDPLEGVVCTDDISSNVTVTTSGKVDLTVPGFYVIGNRAHDTAGNWNDGQLCPGGPVHYRRIIVVTSGVAAVARQHARGRDREKKRRDEGGGCPSA